MYALNLFLSTLQQYYPSARLMNKSIELMTASCSLGCVLRSPRLGLG